jgi:PAS domain S-box-containing protein
MSGDPKSRRKVSTPQDRPGAPAEDPSGSGGDRFHLVARATQDLVWDWDLRRKRVAWAGNTRPFFGCDPDQISTVSGDDYRAWASRVHPEDLPITEAASERALKGGSDSWEHEYRFQRVNGSWALVLERAIIVRDAGGSPIRVVGALQDVSKRRETEEAKTRLAAIVASSSDAIIGKNLDGVVTSWNAAAERIFGYTAAEMVGNSIFTLIPEELHQPERDLLERIRRGERVDFSETERVRKDGGRIYIALSVSPIWDTSGVIIGASSIKRDITERKQAQEELSRREERYRALVTASSSIVWTTDPEGKFQFPQPSWEEYTGQPWVEHAGFGWLNALHPDDRETVTATWERACRDRSIYEVHGRVWSVARRGYRHFIARAAPILDSEAGVREWIGMLTDVEDQWRIEERLRQTERMEAVGRLAGGIAHEANNQMTVVLGAAEFLLPRVDAESARQDVEHIRRAAQRTAAITRQLLAFSRRQVLQPQVVNLNGIVSVLRPILERAIGETSRLILRLAPDLGTVKADSSQLEQVLLNLSLNARDAMPEGGTLTIETMNAAVDEAEMGARQAEMPTAGKYAKLVVTDTGHGMDRETLEHIFEPFFTTKGVGEGTGLGLATVYGIVKQSGGFITATSAPGQGTVFQVYLPLMPSTLATGSLQLSGSPEGGDETVLVVEDDAAVRSIMARTLRAHGYTVYEADDGTKGLDFVCSRSGRVDLVIADVVMPEMGGKELAAQLARRFPDVSVLLTSGYTGPEAARDVLRGKGRDFIQKPVDPEALTWKIRKMLDAAKQGTSLRSR